MENTISFVSSRGYKFPIWFYNGLFYSTANRAVLRMIDAGIFNFQVESPDENWIVGTMYHEAICNMCDYYLDQPDDSVGLIVWANTKRALRLLHSLWQNKF